MHNPMICLIGVFLIFGLISVSSAQGNEMMKVGTDAPDFTAGTIDGKGMTLSKKLAENPVVLVFIRGFS